MLLFIPDLIIAVHFSWYKLLLLDSLLGQRGVITPLCSPPYTPVRFRIDFKTVLLTFKDLNCLALEYSSDLLT